MVQTGFSGENFNTLPIDESAIPLNELSSISKAIAQYRDSIQFIEGLFKYHVLFLFFGFAFIGSLVLLSRNTRNRYGFALVTAGMAILAINFLGLITNRGFLVNRWILVLQVMQAIPVGIAFLWLGSISRSKTGNACLVGVLVFILSFLMIMSPRANFDNRTFSSDTLVRYAFTQSELQTATTISSIWDGKIGSDNYTMRFRYLIDDHNEMEDIGKYIFNKDFNSLDNMLILIRREIVEQPFEITSQGPYRLDYDPREILHGQGFSRVYENGSVSGFIKRS
jgi:hypothetical protein